MQDNGDERLAGRCILVVEDEWLIALNVQDVLEQSGCVVMGPAASVSEAMELLEAELPDAAVLDVNLQGETSEEVARALERAGCPFVVSTAYGRDSIGPALARAPLLSKPVADEALGRALAQLLS